MPAPYGVTATGFSKKILSEITAELQDDQRELVDPALNFAPTSVEGQFNGIFGAKVRELWDVLEAVYRSAHPDFAEGEALESLCAITGVTRRAATKSTVAVTISGTPATLVPVGSVVSVVGTEDRFVTLADATIGGGGTISANCESEETGPIGAPSGLLTTIVTPVGGWDTVTNPLDATLGLNEETDAELRLRRISLLFNPGAGTLGSILAAVSEVEGVDDTFAFENVSMITDADGVPAKSFEIVVDGGDDAEIAEAIFDKKPAGIQAYGSTIEAVVDSQGFSHDIGFSRPEEVEIWIEITVVVNTAVFGGGISAEGVTLVEEALVEAGDALNIGEDVIALFFKCVPLHEVPGVVDVTTMLIDIVDPPVLTTNYTISNREIAVFDTSRIIVTVVPQA